MSYSPLVLLATGLFPVLPFGTSPWNDWHVDVNDPNCATGTGGPSDPFCTIRRAISFAVKGDRVLIAPGTYNEHVNLQKGLTLVGTDGPAVTIINGTTTSPVVYCYNYNDPMKLKGLTVTGGLDRGVDVDAGSLTLRNCRVVGNAGTGVYVLYGHIDLKDSLIDGNGQIGVEADSKYGGGSMQNTTVSNHEFGVINVSTITDSVICNNSTIGVTNIYGGTLTNTTISGNGRGADVYGYYSGYSMAMTGCVITDNSIGGMSVMNMDLTLSHTTIAGNSSPFGGGGLFVSGSATVTVDHTIIAGNSSATGPDCWGTLDSAGYNLVQDTTDCTIVGDPTGNQLGVDPLFVNLAGGDYRLQSISPALDVGSPGVDPCDQDLVDTPRVLDADLDAVMVVDLGAYEFSNATLTVTGNATPGGQLNADVTGTPGLLALLWVDSGTGQTSIPPFGCFLVDPNPPNLNILLGVLPVSTLSGTIPVTVPVGTALDLQAQVFAPGSGNFSNAVHLVIE